MNRNAEAGPSQTQPERERLLNARKANELIRRKGEKWADKLMEETVDKETFKRAVSDPRSRQVVRYLARIHCPRSSDLTIRLFNLRCFTIPDSSSSSV